MHEAMSLEWKHEAACRGRPDADELFFPPSDGVGGVAVMEWRVTQRVTAFAICAACPVRRECLAYAEAQGEEAGVWGGVDFGERFNRARSATRKKRDDDHEVIRERVALWAGWAGRGVRPPAIARRLDVHVRTVHRCLRAGS